MQTTVTYSEALIRRAVFRYWVRFVAWHGFAFIAFSAAVCIAAVFLHAETWIIGCSLLLCGFMISLAATVYIVRVRVSLAIFRRMNNPTAEVTISDDEFRVKTSLVDSRLQWRVIQAIWQFPETWLIFTGKHAFMILPIDAVGTEDRELICRKVKENGGRVV